MNKFELKEIYKSSLYWLNKFIEEEQIDKSNIVNVTKTLNEEYFMIYIESSTELNFRFNLYMLAKMDPVPYKVEDKPYVGQIVTLSEELRKGLLESLDKIKKMDMIAYNRFCKYEAHLDKEFIVTKVDGKDVELSINSIS